MGIKYREDEDLVFMQYCQEDDLKILTRYLTYGKNGLPEPSSELLENSNFKLLDGQSDQHIKSWNLIAGELQHFGGDTFVNMVRGTGVEYKETLRDVCDKMKVKYKKESSAYEIENDLLQKLIKDSWEQMSEDQQHELLNQIGLDASLKSAAGLAALQTAIKLGGFVSYQISLVIANAVAKALIGRGLTFIANQALVRTLSVFAGPIGWAFAAITALPAISGPAYRVTIPAVIQVAYMRRALAEKKQF